MEIILDILNDMIRIHVNSSAQELELYDLFYQFVNAHGETIKVGYQRFHIGQLQTEFIENISIKEQEEELLKTKLYVTVSNHGHVICELCKPLEITGNT